MDSMALVGRLILSLAVVLGLMWVIARRVRKGPGRVRNGQLMDIVARQQLSRTASVAVVRVLDKALIVGITDGQVNVLGEADLDAVESRLAENAPAPRPQRARPARPAQRPAPAVRPPRPVPVAATPATPPEPVPTPRAERADVMRLDQQVPQRKSPLAGSALSLGTWRQTVESIRDLTVRTR